MCDFFSQPEADLLHKLNLTKEIDEKLNQKLFLADQLPRRSTVNKLNVGVMQPYARTHAHTHTKHCTLLVYRATHQIKVIHESH